MSTSLPSSQPVLRENSHPARQSSSLSQAILSQRNEENCAVSEAEDALLREIGISSPAAEEKPADAVISLTDDEDESLKVKLARSLEPDVNEMPDKSQLAAQPTTSDENPERGSSAKVTAVIGKENCIALGDRPQSSQKELAMQSAAPAENPLPPQDHHLQCTPGHAIPQPVAPSLQVSLMGTEPPQQLPPMQTPHAVPREGVDLAGGGKVQEQDFYKTPQAATQQVEAAVLMPTAAEKPKLIQFPAPSSHVEWSAEWAAQQLAHFRAVSAAATAGVKSIMPLQSLPGQALKTLSKPEVGMNTSPHKP